LAGGALYAFAVMRRAPKPTRSELQIAIITGLLMPGMGNGGVIWAEQTVSSSLVALIVSMVPIWIVLIDWLRPGGRRPRPMMFLGLALGFLGMIILIGPSSLIGQGDVPLSGILVLFVGSIGWSVGTLMTRKKRAGGSPILFSAIQMLAAGAGFGIASLLFREYSAFSVSQISVRSWLSVVFLVVCGSIIAYTAYVYLLKHTSAAKAATYAYVNPVIAVILGWLFANEPIGARTLVAAAVLLAGVAIITSLQSGPAPVTDEHPVPTPSMQPERSAA